MEDKNKEVLEEVKASGENVTGDEETKAAPAEAPETAPKERKDAEPVDETGIIAAYTRIKGDITTWGNLVIYGEVEGNISALGDVTASGKITGDISCRNLSLAGCRAKSRIDVKEAVILDNRALIDGDVKCSILTADGQVKGNIEAADEINIHGNAEIVGEIRTRSITVDAGAQLQGSINVVR